MADARPEGQDGPEPPAPEPTQESAPGWGLTPEEWRRAAEKGRPARPQKFVLLGMGLAAIAACAIGVVAYLVVPHPPVLKGPPVGERADLLPDVRTMRDGEFTPPPRSKGPVTYVRFVSVGDDLAAGGGTYLYEEGQIKANWHDVEVRAGHKADTGVGITVSAGAPPGESGADWVSSFTGPRLRPLGVGLYRDADRFGAKGAPGLDAFKFDRHLKPTRGHFVVWELFRKGGTITHLAIDFVQQYEDTTEVLCGRIRYRSSFH